MCHPRPQVNQLSGGKGVYLNRGLARGDKSAHYHCGCKNCHFAFTAVKEVNSVPLVQISLKPMSRGLRPLWFKGPLPIPNGHAKKNLTIQRIEL